MKISDALLLQAAIAKLSGSVTQMFEGQPVEVSLKFSGATRLKLARASAFLTTVLAPFNEARAAIIKQHGGPFTKADEPGQREAAAEITALMEGELDASPPPLSLPESEFTRDDNPVSPAVLEQLLPYFQA